MARLVLMVVLGLVAAFYFPDSRAVMMDIAEPVIVPVERWSTSAEMRQVGENVLEHERLTGKLPDRRTWLGWLDYRYSSDDLRQDPWGSMYQLRVWADSVAIVSWGPDAMSSTEDDFQVVVPRER
ncbi:MAG TPA: hypothetical protein EYQ27_06815 [Gemmatimonadetes bacterium]|nr:hypothetical protein [Gemmatimonadota bacterium]